MAKVDTYRDLEVYQAAFALQGELFEISKAWPRVEDYALIDQIRRSSRSVGSNLAEAWAKRRYPAHFLSKLSDSDGEALETLHWLETARQCGYLDPAVYCRLEARLRAIGGMLGNMMIHHQSFCFQSARNTP